MVCVTPGWIGDYPPSFNSLSRFLLAIVRRRPVHLSVLATAGAAAVAIAATMEAAIPALAKTFLGPVFHVHDLVRVVVNKAISTHNHY